MKRNLSTKVVVLALVFGLAPTLAVAQKRQIKQRCRAKGKTCRMEQQSHWENFKKRKYALTSKSVAEHDGGKADSNRT